jgi:hypothetical protein
VTLPHGQSSIFPHKRESAQSWRELLIDVRQRGLRIAPEIAVGDGALPPPSPRVEHLPPPSAHLLVSAHEGARTVCSTELHTTI